MILRITKRIKKKQRKTRARSMKNTMPLNIVAIMKGRTRRAQLVKILILMGKRKKRRKPLKQIMKKTLIHMVLKKKVTRMLTNSISKICSKKYCLPSYSSGMERFPWSQISKTSKLTAKLTTRSPIS